LLAIGIALVTAPFVVGLVRVSRGLARLIGQMALPSPSDGLDLVAAPRRALVVTLQLGLLLVVGAPLVAITQPFLRTFRGAELLLLGVVVLAFTVWRTATNLEGHVRASAQVLVEHLARQAGPDATAVTPAPLSALFEGLGEPVSIELTPDSPATGKTLAELNLRGRTGALVLAIRRANEAIVVPVATERLRPGDVLVVAGTHEAAEAARPLLQGH
jgi:CPA2 family monovalent cation:H+ antiporter-2